MKYAEYEEALFEAYIGTPEKFDWYRKAFDVFAQKERGMRWYWNSWAFLGGFWYFLYRKQMKMAMIVLFVFLVMAVVVPLNILLILFLFLSFAIGGFGSYFIYTNYLERKSEIAMIVPEREKRIRIMAREFGGVNRWAVPMALFSLVSLLLIVAGLMRVAAAAG